MIVMSFVVGPILNDLTYGQSEQPEWKTYVNPQHGFTLEYPDRYDSFLITRPNGNSVAIDSNSYAEHFWEISLNIEPFNSTKFKDLKGVADYWYNKSVVENGAKSLYEVNGTEFTKFSTYSYSDYIDEYDNPGKYRIFKLAYQLHDGNLFTFFLSDLSTDTHFDEFDRFVNSLKFFN